MNDELIERWLAGEASEAEAASLAAALRDDEQALDGLCADLRLVLALRAEQAAADGQSVVRAVRAAREAGRTSRRYRQLDAVRSRLRSRRKPARPQRFWLPAALAAGLLLLCLPWMLPSAPAAGWQVSGGRGHLIADGSTVTIDALQDRSLAAREWALVDDAHVQIADAEAGLQLSLAAGARFTPEDPARGAFVLAGGQLTAEVEPRPDQHFAIQTPHALVQVVGTAFTVDVGRQTAVSVEHGQVSVVPAGADAGLLVGAGGLVRVDGSGRLLCDPELVSADQRVLDDHSGELAWQVLPWSDPVSIGLVGVADPALHFAYDYAPEATGYGAVSHALTIPDDVRAVQLRFRVLESDAEAEFSLLLRQQDGSTWLMAVNHLASLPRQRWLCLQVPLATVLKKNNTKGLNQFDRRSVIGCTLIITRGSGDIEVDDLAFLPAP